MGFSPPILQRWNTLFGESDRKELIDFDELIFKLITARGEGGHDAEVNSVLD